VEGAFASLEQERAIDSIFDEFKKLRTKKIKQSELEILIHKLKYGITKELQDNENLADAVEERLYNRFYEGFEVDGGRNGEASKSMYNFGNYVRYAAGAVALFFAGNLIRKVKKKQEMTRREFIEGSSLAAAATGFGFATEGVSSEPVLPATT
jgi:hypothetical protein